MNIVLKDYKPCFAGDILNSLKRFLMFDDRSTALVNELLQHIADKTDFELGDVQSLAYVVDRDMEILDFKILEPVSK